MRYWHIGRSRKARAMVAIIAVQMAKSICMESKKKNMTRREMEAPSGRHRACIVSSVCTLFSAPWPLRSFCSCSMLSDLKLPYTMSRMEMRKVETRDESTKEYAHWYSDMTAAFSRALNDASLAAFSGGHGGPPSVEAQSQGRRPPPKLASPPMLLSPRSTRRHHR